MSRFTDYVASAITPQMTLLEKFNALLKFLEENEFQEPLYRHSITFYKNNSHFLTISFIDTNSNTYDINDFAQVKNFDTRKIINLRCGTSSAIPYFGWIGTGTQFQFFYAGETTLTSKTINSSCEISAQTVERIGNIQ